MKRKTVAQRGDIIINYIREKWPSMTGDETRKLLSNLYRRFWKKPMKEEACE